MFKRNYLLFTLLMVGLASCTIAPSAKQYAVESDFINGAMVVHEGPGIKDWSNFLDDVSYYDKVGGFDFEQDPISIRFANNNVAYLAGYSNYRLPTGEADSLMVDIEEEYEGAERVKSELIRNALIKAAFNTGQFMNVFDALGKKRSYLQELIFDQANNGQYQVTFKEAKVMDIATNKEVLVKISDRIECIEGENCIAGYIRTEKSALKLYGIELFNFTIKNLRGADKVEEAIASNLERSNKMEELAIEARESQVKASTTVENAKADVAIKQAEKEVAVAEAEKQTAVAAEELKQEQFKADAIFYGKKKEADADKLKNIAGLSPLERETLRKETAIGIAEALAKRPMPFIINGVSKGNGLSKVYENTEQLLLLSQLQKKQ